MIIAQKLTGNPRRYIELLAANPHKPIVHVRGIPTFASLGVGERLNVPSGFVGGDFDDLPPVERTEVVFTDPQIAQQRKETEERPELRARAKAHEEKFGWGPAGQFYEKEFLRKKKKAEAHGSGSPFDFFVDIAEFAVNPKALLDEIPGINELTKHIPDMPDPIAMTTEVVNAVVSGDLDALKKQVFDIGYTVADVVSMVPGVGNVIGGPLASALTLLETGSPLKAALALLLGQVPGIPPTIRDILRIAFNAIADIVEKSKSVTDVLLVEFKKGVKEQIRKKGITGPIADLIETVLNGAIQLILEDKPLDETALDVAEKGLNVARANVPEGVALPKELIEAEKTLSDLRQIYTKVNSAHALTQDIIKLAKQDPAKKNPVTQKQLKDLRAAGKGKKLTAQGHAKRVSKPLKRRPPTLRKGLSPKEQEQLRQLAALKKMSPEEQEALAALSPQEREQLRELELAKLSPKEQEDLRKLAEAKAAAPPAPAPAAVAPPVPAPAAPRAFRYGPYPQAAA